MIDANSRSGRKIYSAEIFSPRLYASGLAVIVQQSAFIRTAALKQAGGFNVANRTCWDGESFVALAVTGARFKRVWTFWGRFRIYPTSISGSGNFALQIAKDHEAICANYCLNAHPRLVRLALWIAIRTADVRRWPSYLKGRIRPTELAGIGARSEGIPGK
jgi:hypothetical protein